MLTRIATVEAVVLFALWLALSGSLGPAELAAAAAGAVLSGVVAAAAYAAAPVRFWPTAAVLDTWRLPYDAVRDSLRLVGALARRLTGEVRRPDAHRLDREPPSETATVLLNSATPNTIVIDVDRDEKAIRYHQMAPSPLKRTGAGR